MKRRLAFLVPILVVTLALSTLLAVPAMASWWENASTRVNIQGPTGPVPTGSSVTLIVTETNDGAPAYWLSEPWVSLEPGGYILNKANYFYGGDIDNDGILDVGETWEWRINAPVNQDTLFTAIGHGFATGNDDQDVTYGVLDCCGNMCFPNEKFELWVYVIPPPPPGNEGFTPGFWKNHLNAWPPTGYSTADNFNTVFGVLNKQAQNLTLGRAIGINGGGEKALMRHATAALLNAAHPNVDYPLTVAQVIAVVQQAYASGDFTGAKDILEPYNELEGNINN